MCHLSSGGTQKNVANDVSITTSASGITLQDDGGSGGLASNYTLVGGTHQVDITQAPVTIDLTRQYDGTTDASSNATDSNISEAYNGLIGSETLTLTGQGLDQSVSMFQIQLDRCMPLKY